jgi:hypothetical protein
MSGQNASPGYKLLADAIARNKALRRVNRRDTSEEGTVKENLQLGGQIEQV